MKMTVSYEWLCALVPGLEHQKPADLSDVFTALGAETEDFRPINYGSYCKLAQVIKISPLEGKNIHVTVKIDQDTFQTVSNSKRLKEGDFVIFVPVGGKIVGDRIVEAKTINGITTQGLLSALEYLGIEDKSPDIFIFPNPQTANDDFKTIISEDAVYTLDVSGNRPDWLSVAGLARALAIYFNLPLKLSTPSFKEDPSKSVSVSIESDRCFRFSARLIDNISISSSPMLIQKRLLLLGMRPINNMVDFSNHIMLETGQPTHAYDASCVKEGFVIRQAKNGEKLVLLGGDKEISLTEDDLLICDNEKILGLAGIMGGSYSKVTPETKAVILESASFHGVHIRRTAKRIGLKTESSSRYEKNIAPALAETADALFASYFPHATISSKTEAIKQTPPVTTINISPDWVRQKLGTNDLSNEFIKKTWEGLGCSIKMGDEWQVTVPQDRFDLSIPEDLVEEAARFYGYNNIEPQNYRPSTSNLNPETPFADKIRPLLRGMGVHEAVTLSFRSPEDRKDFFIEKQPVVIENPLTEDFSELRTYLFDGLTRTLALNKKKAFVNGLAFSEIARVFSQENKSFIEEKHIAFALTDEVNAYDKALNILHNLAHYAKWSWTSAPANLPFLHPNNSFLLMNDDKIVGFFGELHPHIEDNLDLEHVIVCEIDFDALCDAASVKKPVVSPGLQPPALRDITLSAHSQASAHNISEQLKQMNPNLKEVSFIGVYQNDAMISENRKNLTLRLRFESDESLKGEEIDAFILKLLKMSF
ncbi:MAG: phenylalanine--tRNA ligase subunit beta [Brevinema sp.]